MDPKAALTSETVLQKIDAICKRRCYDPNEADECSVFVWDALKENDFARIRAFKGQSNFNTYLYTVVHRLISDFQVSRYCKRHIPKMVSDLGPWAEAVYRLICFEKYSFYAAYFITKCQGIFTGSYEEFDELAAPIQQAPCKGKPIIEQLPEDGPEVPGPAEDNPLEYLLTKLDHLQRLTAVEVIQTTTAAFSEQDQLLLKMVYGSGASVAKAARVLGLSRPTAARRLDKLLKRYKEKLLAAGIRNW